MSGSRRLENDEERLCRPTSEPADQSHTELTAHLGAEQQRRRGSSSLDGEADWNSVTPPEDSLQSPSASSLVAVRENCRTVPRSGEMFGKWSLALDAEQVERVELFYASHATQISVCRCLASLYFSSASTGMLWTVRTYPWRYPPEITPLVG